MKTLLFETKEIELLVESEATRPKGIAPDHLSSDDKKLFTNVVIAWLCIEDGDTIQDANIICNEIEKYAKMVSRKVVVVPFFHLSENASTNDEFNKGKISYISSQLKRKQLLSAKLGYGYHRSIIAKWMTFGHQVGVAFRSSKHHKLVSYE
tara:strand:+ start:211 stop:663 length:453 start_codon:yes stop_codon:yes gene_type:complete